MLIPVLMVAVSDHFTIVQYCPIHISVHIKVSVKQVPVTQSQQAGCMISPYSWPCPNTAAFLCGSSL